MSLCVTLFDILLAEWPPFSGSIVPHAITRWHIKFVEINKSAYLYWSHHVFPVSIILSIDQLLFFVNCFSKEGISDSFLFKEIYLPIENLL